MPKILDKILGRGSGEPRTAAVQTVGAGAHVTGWNGDMYQQVLVRSVIERFAVACSKLKPEIYGTARPRIRRAVETFPNKFQTWPQFLYRCATLYMNNTTVCIVPEQDDGGTVQTGYFPVPLSSGEVVSYGDDYWFRWSTFDGDTRAVELDRVAVVNRFQYRSDWFGDGNILAATLSMLKAQEEAQKKSIEDSAQLRFIGALNGNIREEDQEKKRRRFAESNLSGGNDTPLMVYDNTFTSIEQLKAQNWTIPSEEMERIENNVFDYFGTNRRILQNTYDENVWDAFYEGCVEPFALMLGEALSKATFTVRERPKNRLTFSANRLEYASAASKRNMNKDMTDRALMTINEAREVLQLPPVDGGDVFILRGEYRVGRTMDELFAVQKAKVEAEGGSLGESSEEDIDSHDADIERVDSEGHGNSGDTDSGDVTTTTQDRWSENAD